MANTTDVVSAIRELTNTKQLERNELIDLLKDGLHAALVKRYGPNVRAEIGIDEMKGSIRIVVLKTVVEAVEDPGRVRLGVDDDQIAGFPAETQRVQRVEGPPRFECGVRPASEGLHFHGVPEGVRVGRPHEQ